MASTRPPITAWLLGLMLLWVASPVCYGQQNPNGVLPLNTTNEPYLFLVRDPEVHKDIELSEEQKIKLTKVNDEVDMLMWTMRNKPNELRSIMEQATTKTQTALRTFLSKPQVRRISQIEVWVLGMKSLLRDNIANYLKLESDQRSDIRNIIETSEASMADLRRQLNDGGDADDLNKQFRELQVNQQKDILAILDEEQKQRWVKVLGKRIDTSKLGRIKFKAPEFASNAGWVNSKPLSMEQLKGKVVALHFYAFH